MKSFFQRAKELEGEIIQNRRYIHEHAEIGNELPLTVKFVTEELTEMGYIPKIICKGGITATVGKKTGGKTILLRADMDALPMKEESNLEFACKGNYVHACGHDIHTAMLLGAAKILKEHEEELDGRVKFMFQPAEELGKGAKAMIDAGILENPKVDAAFAMHVASDQSYGYVGYNKSYIMTSCDSFQITITGKGGHGAAPHMCVDPINVGVHIHLALQEIISRETVPSEMAVITVGQFTAGSGSNIIPHTAVMKGTIRTYSIEIRKHILKRVKEVCELVGKVYRAEVEVGILGQLPSLGCDRQLTEDIISYIEEASPEGINVVEGKKAMGSEDFALLSERVPSTFFFFGAALKDPSKRYIAHNPRVVFDESCMALGAGIFAESAFRWLKDHK